MAARRLVGNFPQAFSHVGLINSARNLAGVHPPAVERPERSEARQDAEYRAALT